MADEAIATTPTAEAPVAETPKPRIFKIGSDTIVEDASMAGLSIADVQRRLAFQYPEAANATTLTGRNAAGQEVIEFLPQAGRKS
ncbi:MAG: hypothetical protein H6639_23835 [Caldilineaceae bacterium]|nr:hypothetical protein [Caldilineaceae bacterium]